MDRVVRFGLYKKAFDRWGVNAQVAVAGEELSELYRALSRMETPERYSVGNLVEEMADAIIVCEQVMLIYEIDDLVEEQLDGWRAGEFKVWAVGLRRALGRLMSLLCDHFDRGHIDPRELQRLLVEVLYGIENLSGRWDLSLLVERQMGVKLARLGDSLSVP